MHARIAAAIAPELDPDTAWIGGNVLQLLDSPGEEAEPLEPLQ